MRAAGVESSRGGCAANRHPPSLSCSRLGVAIVGELALAVLLEALATTTHRRIEHLLNHIIFRAQCSLCKHCAGLRTRWISFPIRTACSRKRTTRSVRGLTVTSSQSTLRMARHSCWHRRIRIACRHSFRSTISLCYACEVSTKPSNATSRNIPSAGSLLLPMTAHAQLVGFITCGPKHDRTHYLPDEVETLSTLAHRSGSAYLWLTARQPTISAVPTPTYP